MPDIIRQFLPVLIPIVFLDWVLKIICFKILVKYPEEIKGSRLLWMLAILFIQLLGSAAFLSFGRERT